MSSLYHLTGEIREAEMAMRACDMDEQTIYDTLEGLSPIVQEKALSVAYFIRNMEAEETAIKDAMASMKARADSMKGKREHLVKYLHDCMVASGIKQVSCPSFELTVVNNPPKVVIDDDVPAEFLVHKETYTPDKKAIKEACESGGVSFAHIDKGTRLRIK